MNMGYVRLGKLQNELIYNKYKLEGVEAAMVSSRLALNTKTIEEFESALKTYMAGVPLNDILA